MESRFARLLLVCVAAAGCSQRTGGLPESPPPVGWPTTCDLSSVAIPSGTAPVRASCLRLWYAASVRHRVCPSDRSVLPEREFVDACVALASAPGSLLVPADLDACAAAVCEPYCDEPPSCLAPAVFAFFTGNNLLSPGHDRKGTLPPGSSCIANLQCDSGQCCGRYGNCLTSDPCTTVCKRLVPLGGSCADRPGEPPDTNVCVDGACRDGTCVFHGFPDGTPCTWYYAAEGCQHRCLPSAPGQRGQCAPLGEVGQWCGNGSNSPECAPGLVCGRMTCIAPQLDGETCQTGLSCQHTCLDDGTCGRRRYGLGVGEPCAGRGCLPELACVAGRCAIPTPPDLAGVDMAASGLPANAPCRLGEPCQFGQTCWATCEQQGCFDKARCLDEPAEGAPCLAFGNCGATRYCWQGACRSPSAQGGPCPCLPSAVCGLHGSCVAWGPGACQ